MHHFDASRIGQTGIRRHESDLCSTRSSRSRDGITLSTRRTITKETDRINGLARATGRHDNTASDQIGGSHATTQDLPCGTDDLVWFG
jgi:hypothetical protein